MRPLQQLLAIVTLLVQSSAALVAQAPPDPAGHWEGSVQAPDRQVLVAIDLARNSKGQLAGTFTQADQNIKGLPLASVVHDGATVRLELRAGSGGGTFNGRLSADGKSLDGEFITSEGGLALPFTLKNTGEVRTAPDPKSPPISKEFEGTWNGTLEVGGRQVRLSLTLANQPDGTSSGTVVSPEAGGVDIPIVITQTGTSLAFDVRPVGASFVGLLNSDGKEIAGAWKQGGGSLPLTLKRAATP